MALENLISIGFTQQEAQTINDALTAVENTIRNKVINLTPKQRQAYGRVKYEMEIWVQKVYQYMVQYPNLVPSYIDVAEHGKDINAHNFINPLLARIGVALQSLEDTNLLLGSDIYTNSMAFYRNVKVAAQNNAPDAGAVYADLKQQFPGPGSKPAADNKLPTP
jgi:hypothetical protein